MAPRAIPGGVLSTVLALVLTREWWLLLTVACLALFPKARPHTWLHPNYLAVALELLSLPLVFNAWVTALVASLLNAALLLLIRIPMEEYALKQIPGKPDG